MKILSEFLTEYVKDYLFNGERSGGPTWQSEGAETFDEQLQRVICEGILMYHRRLRNGHAILLPDSKESKIRDALMMAEGINVDNEIHSG